MSDRTTIPDDSLTLAVMETSAINFFSDQFIKVPGTAMAVLSFDLRPTFASQVWFFSMIIEIRK